MYLIENLVKRRRRSHRRPAPRRVALLLMLTPLVLLGCGGGDVLTIDRTPLSTSPTSEGSAAHPETTIRVSTTGLPTASPSQRPASRDTTIDTTSPMGADSTWDTAIAPLGLTAVPADIKEAFTSVATALSPVPVFAPDILPPGSSLAQDWWPVLDSPESAAGDGPTACNPRIQEQGPQPEAQLVVETPSGVLLFLQNFRGDLGDVSGRPVTKIGERTVSAYELAGGTLLQWSHEGRWYGIFGRGEWDSVLIAIASEMAVLQP